MPVMRVTLAHASWRRITMRKKRPKIVGSGYKCRHLSRTSFRRDKVLECVRNGSTALALQF